jgi:hypothetical protein
MATLASPTHVDSPTTEDSPASEDKSAPMDRPALMDDPAPADSSATEDSTNYAKENQDTLETFQLKRHQPMAFRNLEFLDLSGCPKVIPTPLFKFKFNNLEKDDKGRRQT